MMSTSYLAKELNLSRPKIDEYLSILEKMDLIWSVLPFEAKAVDKRRLFAFDTGLISWARGWRNIEQANLELLWKHMVLGHIRSSLDANPIYYWQRERLTVDFVCEFRERLVAIDTCWSGAGYKASGMQSFNEMNQGRKHSNYVFCPEPVGGRIAAQAVARHSIDGWTLKDQLARTTGMQNPADF